MFLLHHVFLIRSLQFSVILRNAAKTEPIEVLGTFEAEIRCEDSAKSCLDGLTVLHINRNVKPVAQPVRRLPFGLTL